MALVGGMCFQTPHVGTELFDYFLNQIAPYPEPPLSTSYSLLGLEYSPQVMRSLRKLTGSRSIQKALWLSIPTGHSLLLLTVRALRGGLASVSTLCLGSQGWKELKVPAPITQVPPPPQPSSLPPSYFSLRHLSE